MARQQKSPRPSSASPAAKEGPRERTATNRAATNRAATNRIVAKPSTAKRSPDKPSPHPGHVQQIVQLLQRHYGQAECALQFETPFQLLIATILSAQCTDARVNLVTRPLFARYPTASALASVPVAELETWIQSTGFFRNKAQNIHACCKALVRDYDGDVPRQLDQLVQLAGVGRKTANVVLGTAYGIAAGIVVDTHVGRLSRRLGLTDAVDPVQIERELMLLLPSSEWIQFSHRLIHHGRAYCQARRPQCETCPLSAPCPRVGVESPIPSERPPQPATSARRASTKRTQS